MINAQKGEKKSQIAESPIFFFFIFLISRMKEITMKRQETKRLGLYLLKIESKGEPTMSVSAFIIQY